MMRSGVCKRLILRLLYHDLGNDRKESWPAYLYNEIQHTLREVCYVRVKWRPGEAALLLRVIPAHGLILRIGTTDRVSGA